MKFSPYIRLQYTRSISPSPSLPVHKIHFSLFFLFLPLPPPVHKIHFSLCFLSLLSSISHNTTTEKSTCSSAGGARTLQRARTNESLTLVLGVNPRRAARDLRAARHVADPWYPGARGLPTGRRRALSACVDGGSGRSVCALGHPRASFPPPCSSLLSLSPSPTPPLLQPSPYSRSLLPSLPSPPPFPYVQTRPRSDQRDDGEQMFNIETRLEWRRRLGPAGCRLSFQPRTSSDLYWLISPYCSKYVLLTWKTLCDVMDVDSMTRLLYSFTFSSFLIIFSSGAISVILETCNIYIFKVILDNFSYLVFLKHCY